jgi:general secretion pathway protein A
MYTGFFGLNEKPFAITPDPRYLFLSERHAEALAHLLYGVTESGGFIQLTGEVGTGKTTVVRSLLEQLPPDTEVALVLNPRLSPHEFLLAICEELRIALTLEDRGSAKAIVDSLNQHLLEAHADGRRVVLIVDEAQNLSPDVLEQIRLLTNLETAKQKLLQIILIGQPELRQLLARTDLRQLAQRVTGRYHLEPLDQKETRAYIRHRLRVAGGGGETFTNGATSVIHHQARGIPRLINVICDRALLGAYSREQTRVTSATAARAAREVAGKGNGIRAASRYWWLAAAGVLIVAAYAFAWFNLNQPTTPASADAQTGTRNSRPAINPGPAASAAETPGESPAAIITEPPAAAVRNGPKTDGAVAETTATKPLLAEFLDARQSLTGTDTAFTTLLELWDVEYSPPSGRGCAVAESARLRCLYDRGTWGFLLNLNRPAILSLSAADGTPHQVVLSSVSANGTATLRVLDEQIEVSLVELMPFWLGDFLVVWKPASGTGRVLTPGSTGDDVVWLREALSTVLETRIPADNPALYDDGLRRAVERFQRTQRLIPDGVAGARTMIALSSAMGLPGRPQLSAGG